MELHPRENGEGECIAEVLESFLYDGIKVLKKVVDAVEKTDGPRLIHKEAGSEIRMNDAIDQINNDIQNIREMLTLTNNEHTRLREADEKLSTQVDYIVKAVEKRASIATVNRDFKDIESEFNLKICKIAERLMSNEKSIRFQDEKLFPKLYQLREGDRMLETIVSRVCKIEEKIDSITAGVVQTDKEMLWMKELHEQLSSKVEDMLDDDDDDGDDKMLTKI